MICRQRVHVHTYMLLTHLRCPQTSNECVLCLHRPVQHWTSIILNQVDMFLFFLPTDKLKELSPVSLLLHFFNRNFSCHLTSKVISLFKFNVRSLHSALCCQVIFKTVGDLVLGLRVVKHIVIIDELHVLESTVGCWDCYLMPGQDRTGYDVR